jgi:hypothetical protein
MEALLIRPAILSEPKELAQLQLRASLGNIGDRDALLAQPDAVELGIDQIAQGRVFVLECKGEIVGFAAVEPRADGDTAVARKQGSRHLHVVGNPHAAVQKGRDARPLLYCFML